MFPANTKLVEADQKCVSKPKSLPPRKQLSEANELSEAPAARYSQGSAHPDPFFLPADAPGENREDEELTATCRTRASEAFPFNNLIRC